MECFLGQNCVLNNWVIKANNRQLGNIKDSDLDIRIICIEVIVPYLCNIYSDNPSFSPDTDDLCSHFLDYSS